LAKIENGNDNLKAAVAAASKQPEKRHCRLKHNDKLQFRFSFKAQIKQHQRQTE